MKKSFLSITVVMCVFFGEAGSEFRLRCSSRACSDLLSDSPAPFSLFASRFSYRSFACGFWSCRRFGLYGH
jgi:hypothetical protein